MKEKILMWRSYGETQWREYILDEPFDINEFELSRVYTYEYKIIERDK